jgi:oligoribonuclease
MKVSPDTHLLWVDIESSGLDPFFNVPLEIGLQITDGNLIPVAEMESLVYWKYLDRTTVDPVVQKMHDESGLWEALDQAYRKGLAPTSTSLDLRIEEFVMRHFEPASNIVLAGSSIGGFDVPFMKEFFPRTYALLHYRRADVSAMRELVRRWMPDHDELLAAVPQRKLHRVRPDLDDSVALAKFYLNLFEEGSGFNAHLSPE